MSVTSVSTTNLDVFTKGSAQGRASIGTSAVSLKRLAAGVVGSCNFHPPTKTIPDIDRLLKVLSENQKYVQTIRDEAVKADGQINDNSLKTALTNAGLASTLRIDRRDTQSHRSKQAGDVLRKVGKIINEGDDAAISNGELNDIKKYLGTLEGDELAYVFENLTDLQQKRMFDNVHGSGWTSNDWDDKERAEFYDIIFKMDATAVDGLAGVSPFIQVGMPSNKSGVVLGKVQHLIDAGGDDDIDNDELNDIKKHLGTLEGDEVAHVLESLTDDQTKYLFDNVHGSGVWSNDWDDRERAEFYDIIFKMDATAVDGLAGVSPYIQTGMPSNESGVVLGKVQRLIDAGGDDDIDNDELNDIKKHLGTLEGSEIAYVFGNLADDQIKYLFDNVHGSGWFSNDWDDGERNEFYMILHKMDEDSRQKIARFSPRAAQVDDLALYFDGRTIVAYDKQSNQVVRSWAAVSGQLDGEGRTQPEEQSVSDRGPTPEGIWNVEPSNIETRKWHNVGWDEGPWGRYRTKLEAADGTETFGRHGMYLHGGDEPGSIGCIDLTEDNDSFHNWLERRSEPIELIVDYPEFEKNLVGVVPE